ncbi:DUF5000 domain-containing lipoprotein [Mucilaginibacter sp. SG564]|uniref:DUF5000 domain-containing lipoprotein n=1 Tax=unclassified Mucilaginibacter TaxID=2617802 RepID=UPI001555F07B|nr:DUF5000 domain-containing lipoprotein [Mucilaginibacter sp. SG564]NOW93623.1 hypothetical protein [Mucilaginibacter sp. SG564]
MKNINRYSLQLLMGLLMIGIISCKRNDGFNTGPISTDKTKPGVVTNIKVDNFNGGSYITYNLPNSENLLYVLAKYSIRDKVARETKSSYYKDTVEVNGFAESKDYQVTLYAVSKAEVMSDPVTVTVHPKTPVYQLVRPTAAISADFGGVNVKALNPLKRDIGIIVTAFDDVTKSMEVQEQHFTKGDTIDFSIRGFKSTPRNFGVYITDEWGNISDTLKKNLTPLYEELLDKGLFATYALPSDDELYEGGGWTVNKLWDGSLDDPGWHTNSNSTPPFTCTFSVGKTYKLSRFKMWGRKGFEYGHGNPRDFSIWGSNKTLPADAVLPISAPVGTVIGDWTNLGNYHWPAPPSGLPPTAVNQSDKDFFNQGAEFNIPFDAPSVKYLRISIAKTWSGGTLAHIIEVSFYGKPD